MLYKMRQYDDDYEWLVDITETEKRITIKLVEGQEKPFFTYGCIDELFDKGKMIIPKDLKPHRVSKHLLQVCDGMTTFYPYRAGIPYPMTPAQ